MKNNYHTHMYLCKHAEGTVEDYVKEAIRLKFKSIGISDHAPLAIFKGSSVRMDETDYPKYLKQMNDAIEKYHNKIKIYKAVEIEYFDDLEEHYKKLLKELDYLIVGQHYIKVDGKLISSFKIKEPEELRIYKDTLIQGIKSGYFKFVAHPDVFLMNQKKLSNEILEFCKEIILTAKKYNVPLEINVRGIRRGLRKIDGEKKYVYPRKEFWELVKTIGAKVVINADAHKPSELSDQAIKDAYEFSSILNITVEEELVID